MTTLIVDEDGTRLTLDQVAEKDQVKVDDDYVTISCSLLQMFCKDSSVLLEVDPDDKDILIMTCITKQTIAWKKFQRQITPDHKHNRKISAPF